MMIIQGKTNSIVSNTSPLIELCRHNELRRGTSIDIYRNRNAFIIISLQVILDVVLATDRTPRKKITPNINYLQFSSLEISPFSKGKKWLPRKSMR